MKTRICTCRDELMIDPKEALVIHLVWCPKGYTVRDYDDLPWYKKILTTNPRKLRFW